MIITKIDYISKKAYIYIDDEYRFWLYPKELTKYHIILDNEISNDDIRYIQDLVIYKRAKERALFLIEKKPFSVKMMRDRLKHDKYSEYVIHKVIEFLEFYRYLDDDEYIRMYVHTYEYRKNRQQLIQCLLQKGIAKDKIQLYFEENDYSELECFKKQFYKYIRNKNLQDISIRNKVFQYFYGKGFSVELIRQFINNVS